MIPVRQCSASGRLAFERSMALMSTRLSPIFQRQFRDPLKIAYIPRDDDTPVRKCD